MFQLNKKLAKIVSNVFLFALPVQLFAQEVNQSSNACNTVFIEIGGNAGQYAFNYGRMFYLKEAFKLTASSGFSLWAEKIDGSTVWNPALPLELTSLLGRNRHHLELGFGITPFLEAEIISSFESGELVQTKGSRYLGAILPFRIGYRYQKPDQGFFFRLGYTPFFKFTGNSEENITFQPVHAGIGLGWSF